MALGLLFMAGAVGLTGYNLWEADRAEELSTQSAVEVQAVIEEYQESQTVEFEVPDYVLAPEIEMPTVALDGDRYVGLLEIPCLGLNLPVIDDWSYGALKCAPCRYTGSVYKNDMVIMAHNYRSHFGRLRSVGLGEVVTFTDLSGNVFNYEAVDIETLQATQIEEMTSGDWDLTLFTCTTSGQARVAVRFELIG